jgi:hypothetical protein
MYNRVPQEAVVESVIPGFSLGKMVEEQVMDSKSSKSTIGQAIIKAIPLISVIDLTIESARRIIDPNSGKYMMRINENLPNQCELRPKTPQEIAEEAKKEAQAAKEAENGGKPKQKKSINGKLMHSVLDAKLLAVAELKLLEEQIAEGLEILSKADETIRAKRLLYEGQINEYKEDDLRKYVLVSLTRNVQKGDQRPNAQKQPENNA